MKSKRILCLLLVFAFTIGFTVFNSGITAKASSLDEADTCLEETVSFMYGEDGPIQSLTYYRQEIYNYDLLPFDYAYTISLNNQKAMP